MIKKKLNIGLLILRIAIGALMLLHGLAKLGGSLGFIQGMLVQKGLPGFIAYGVFIGEIIAPLAILVGYRTRIAAAIYAFNCLVAILLVHSKDVFSLGEQGGWAIELIGLYLFGAVSLFFIGGGKYAISNHNKWD